MKREIFFYNIKNQKGFSGADIAVAITIIVIAVTVVSMIYVNTTLEGREVTRTAGATRIATNILENIEKLSYEEFIAELKNVGNNEQIFSTKIPKGYDVEIKAINNYGSHTKPEERFDLVRDINLTVKYEVGNIEQKVEFQTVKKRETIEEINKPNLEYLSSLGMNYYPVKYLTNLNAYIKVNEQSELWYNYSNKEWATVIVSKKSENEIFDINGKFKGSINSNPQSEEYTVRYVWVPRFFKGSSKGEFYAFAYLSTGNNKIVPATLRSEADTIFNYNTFIKLKNTEAVNTDTTNFYGKSGKWVIVEGNGITSDDDAKVLNNSKYGPYIIH